MFKTSPIAEKVLFCMTVMHSPIFLMKTGEKSPKLIMYIKRTKLPVWLDLKYIGEYRTVSALL
jgi:hypothetical protein